MNYNLDEIPVDGGKCKFCGGPERVIIPAPDPFLASLGLQQVKEIHMVDHELTCPWALALAAAELDEEDD